MLCRERQREALSAGISLRLGADGPLLRGAPRLVTDLEELRGQSFGSVILTVKAFQLPVLLEQVRGAGLLARRVCTLQNGWSSDKLVLQAFPDPDQVVWVTTTTIAIGMEEGIIVPMPGKGGVAAAQARGPHSPPPPWLTRLRVPFMRARDWRSLKWSKLLLNMACNASCALLDWLPARVVADGPLFRFEMQCLREALHVGRRLGIELIDAPGYPVRRFALACRLHPWLAQRVLGPRIARARGGKPPSFLVDMRAGRTQTEVAFLNGAVAREAAHLGITAPCNARLTALLEEVSAQSELWERYRENPAALLTALHSG